MTVSYTAKVANSQSFGCFLKLLLRWRGSIYKLVWPDLFVFLSLFFSLSLVYRFYLDEEQQRVFEKIAAYCEKYGTLIPVSFVLGFYVSIVVGRWWAQYTSIPWIDSFAIWVNASIRGEEEKDRLLRRTLMRYVCLAVTQCFTLISPRVKKRFPTLDHLVEAGLLMESEREIIVEINAGVAIGAKYPTHWIPLVWATSIVARARTEGKVKADATVKSLIDEINKIKDQCALLISYDWISVPLVYTQVVTLAVYVYFFSCIMGRQWVKFSADTDKSSAYGRQDVEGLDLFFPVFTVLQFFFYMGWLKVAESLLNPFGDDDDDFELNWIVDRNIQVAYLIVDEMHHQHPELLKDQYWDEVVPQELPHTVASEQYKEEAPVSSTANVTVTRDEGEIVLTASKLNIGSIAYIDAVGGGSGTPGSKRASFMRRRFSSARSNSNQSQITVAGGVGSSVKLNRAAGSVTGSAGRLNRIGSAFKRMISRERKNSGGEGGEVFGSLINLPGGPGGQSHDVIPELDENMVTIVSMRKGNEPKVPTVHEIFGSRDQKPETIESSKFASASATPKPQPDPEVQPQLQKSPPTSFDAMTVTIEEPDEDDVDTAQFLSDVQRKGSTSANANKIV